MPDFGIGEGLAAIGSALGIGGLDLGGLLGIGGASAAEAGAGAAGAGAGLGDIVGTGAGLFGGETGLAGTALAGGAGTDLGALTTTAGLGAAGTAADFLGAPGATGLADTGAGFGAGADAAAQQAASSGLASGVGGAPGTSIADLVPGGGPGALPPTAPTPQPTAFGGTTASGTTPSWANATGIPGLGTGTPATAPGAIPSAGGALGIAGPTGAAPIDATSAAAAGTTPAAAAAPAASSPISDLLGKAGTGALKSLTDNPLGVALGAGGLGYNILAGQRNTPNQSSLQNVASTAVQNSNKMVQSGEALQQYLTNGTLPPAYETQIDNAIADAKTNAISNAAQQGLNTDPTKNTALAATLAKIDASRAGMQTQVASTLFSSGSSLISAGQGAAGLSGNLYQALVQNDTTQAANTGKAIATLAQALNSKTGTTAKAA